MMTFRCYFCQEEIYTTRHNIGKLIAVREDGGDIEMCMKCGDEHFSVQDVGWAKLNKVYWIKLRKMRRERGDAKIKATGRKVEKGQINSERYLTARVDAVVAQAMERGAGLWNVDQKKLRRGDALGARKVG